MSETLQIALISTLASILASAGVFIVAWRKSRPEIRKLGAETHAQEADAAETALKSTELATQQLIAMQRRLVEQDKELIALKREVETMRAENAAIRVELDEIKAENERLTQENQAADGVIKKLSADLERALNEIKYLRTRVRGKQDTEPNGAGDADKR